MYLLVIVYHYKQKSCLKKQMSRAIRYHLCLVLFFLLMKRPARDTLNSIDPHINFTLDYLSHS